VFAGEKALYVWAVGQIIPFDNKWLNNTTTLCYYYY
jgi:hypothetical protein